MFLWLKRKEGKEVGRDRGEVLIKTMFWVGLTRLFGPGILIQACAGSDLFHVPCIGITANAELRIL